MKKSAIYIFTFILLAVLPAYAMAQKSNSARAADELFARQQYFMAIDKYKKAYTKVKNNREEKNRITYRMAECYRLTENYRRAEMSYKRLLRYGWGKKHPDILLHLADALKINGKYDDAIEQYQAYTKIVPDDPRGKEGAETAAHIEEWLQNPSKYKVSNLKKINSREADFAPTFISDNYNELAFTSTREGATGKETDKWTGQNFSDLFVSRQDRKQEWSAPVLLDASGNINTKANEGAAQMDSQFKTLYFTRCKVTSNVESGCQIYKSRRTGRRWGNAEAIQITGVDSLQTIGQPTLSSDEKIIIFSSDRRGGIGGKDLWIAKRKTKNGIFERPVNLGHTINTLGDEMFPFLRGDSALYFASDGHGGMGGLDIFVSTKNENGKWTKPKNLKYPINSNYDDFAIIFNPTENWGYFSSNRKGGRGKEDLYYFIQPELRFSLSGAIIDSRTQMAVFDAKVTLIGSNGLSVSTRTNKKGFYAFGRSQLKTNTTYQIKVSKANYFNAVGRITTVGVEFSKAFKKDIKLNPIPKEPIILPEILYDLAKWNLKPQYQDSLQGLVQTLRDNPRLVIELASHTDSRDTEERNDILSQKRARSVVDYLIMRGIDPARLVAKGYGERIPRTLKKDIVKDGFLFKKGTTLDDNFIHSLSSKAEQEAAHSLNRRTEFRILRKDFIPKKKANTKIDSTIQIVTSLQENSTTYKTQNQSELFIIPCVINGYEEQFMFDKNQQASVSLTKAKEMLRIGAINKNDFEGDPEEILKNNTIADKAIIHLDNIRIANKTVTGIQVQLDYQNKTGIIFGNNILKKFGKYHFNTQKHLLIFDEKENGK